MIETVFRLCRKAVLYLRDTPGKQPPCLHERIFARKVQMSYFLAKFVKRGIIRGEFLCYDEDIPAGPEEVYGFLNLQPQSAVRQAELCR